MLSTIGPYINLFEKKIKKLTKSKYVIATINGTSALHIALKLAGVSKNDEVLIPSLNFIASTNATLYCGGIHFIDMKNNLRVDIKKLDDYLMNNTCKVKGRCINKKTNRMIKAIVPAFIWTSMNMKQLSIVSKYNFKNYRGCRRGNWQFFYG